MLGLPRVQLRCQRCQQPRTGITHVCRSNSNRAATVKPKLDWGTCERCHKPRGRNPFTHKCSSPKGDWGKRAKAHDKRNRKQREAHTYQSCNDQDCAKPVCTAFREGLRLGRQEGHDTGYEQGIMNCPRSHQ